MSNAKQTWEVYKSLITGSRPKRRHEQIGAFLQPYLSLRLPPIIVEEGCQMLTDDSIYATALKDSAALLSDRRRTEAITAGPDAGSQAPSWDSGFPPPKADQPWLSATSDTATAPSDGEEAKDTGTVSKGYVFRSP